VIRKKIKDINDAKSAIEHIIKIYKKISLNYDNGDDVLVTYQEAFNRIQKKFRGTDLSLFQIHVNVPTIEFTTPGELEDFRKELITKSEGLKDFLDSKKGKFDPEYKKIEERLEILEKKVKKFDEMLNSAAGELSVFHDWRKDLKEMVDFHRKNKDKRISK